MTSQHAGTLVGRTALVTGAAGVLGRAIAQGFAQAGARVVVSDLKNEPTQQLAKELSHQFGVESYAVTMDVRDARSVEAAAATVTSEFGVCDALAINAGVLVLEPAETMTQEQWDLVISVNLSGAFATATAFGRHLIRSGRPGTIAFSSSLFGVRGGRGNAAYSASKFGVVGLSQSLAAELAPRGIRVNAVCPGQIDTEMMDQLFATRAASSGTTPEQERDDFCKRIPAGHLGSPEDVAKAFLYLSSDASSYVTGQSLIIDGGWQVG